MKITIYSFFIWVMLYSLCYGYGGFGEWVNVDDIKESVDIDEYIMEVTYADARNDGTPRLYAGGGRGFSYPGWGQNIYELEYINSRWRKNIVDYSSRGRDIFGITAGDVRNTGENRLYVCWGKYNETKPWWDNKASVEVNEYSWTGSSWTKVTLWKKEFLCYGSFSLTKDSNMAQGSVSAMSRNALTIGKLKGDNLNRLYICGHGDEGFTELSWSGSTWTVSEIACPTETNGIIIAAEARNDNKERLYVGVDSPEPGLFMGIYEYAWIGSTWQYTVIDTSSTCWPGPFSLVIGPGRNDGINRIYYRDWNTSSLFELSWENNNWVLRQYFIPEHLCFHSPATVVDGRTDGVYRIYSVPLIKYDDKSNVAEFTWNGEGFTHTANIKTNTDDFITQASLFAIYPMKLAQEMNKNYSITGGLRLYVYAYPQDAYDSAKTQQDKLQPVNNYFRKGQGWTTVWYRIDTPGNVRIKIYTINGRLVKTLLDEYKDVGEYSALWTGINNNGENVATGICLLRLEAPGGVHVTKKICVVN